MIPDDRLHPFTWDKKLEDYPKKKIEVIGFVWFDTITNYAGRGNYQVFERPNCSFCSPINIHIENEIQVYEIKDSLFTDPGTSFQWRLVKVTGRVKNPTVMEAERIERAEYSYPDYEESAYVELDLTSAHDHEKSYADGIIIPGDPGREEYVSCILKTAKGEIPVKIKFGTSPNQLENITSTVNIRDQEGKIVKKKKVRVYGYWVENGDDGNILVESIKILK